MTGIRSFIAIDVEEEEIISKIVEIQREISDSNAKLKMVKKENLHFTLKFLGNVEESRLDLVKSIISDIAKEYSPFNLLLHGIGAFPRISRPNVVWVGVLDGREVFIEIARKIDKSLAKLGFKRENKSFEPHLTIARVKGYSGNLPDILRKMSDIEIGTVRIEEIKLKKSTLTPEGPIYETLYSARLEKPLAEEG